MLLKASGGSTLTALCTIRNVQPHIIATSSKLKSAIRKRFTPVILSLA
ncbi:hypothetical protein [Paenibacillus albidus]|nr:hypothetical protein [Paenibacillus albidus]